MLTTMLLPVAPEDQWITPPTVAGAVLKVVDAPLQSSIPLLLLTVGAPGVTLVVMITFKLLVPEPQDGLLS